VPGLKGFDVANQSSVQPTAQLQANGLPEVEIDGVTYTVHYSAALERQGLCPGLSANRRSPTLGLEDEHSDE